jgi:hypothetical protein
MRYEKISVRKTKVHKNDSFQKQPTTLLYGVKTVKLEVLF